MYSMSSLISVAARSDMFEKIFSFISSLAVLRANDSSSFSTSLSSDWMPLSLTSRISSKTKHQPANLLDQLGILRFECLQNALLGGPIRQVEHLRHRIDPARLLELLRHDTRQSLLQPLLHLPDHLGIRLFHVRHPRDDFDLLGRRQPRKNLAPLTARQMGEDQRNRLRMLVLHERQ